MNHSIHSADRATHVKIVVMALVAGITVAGVAISARSNVDYSQSARVIKAGKPVVLTSSDTQSFAKPRPPEDLVPPNEDVEGPLPQAALLHLGRPMPQPAGRPKAYRNVRSALSALRPATLRPRAYSASAVSSTVS